MDQRLSTLATVVVAALLATLGACHQDELATVKVQQAPFVHRVRAEGNLTAVNSTQISVPVQVRGRARVAWMAEDGRRVAQGEVVLRFDARDMQRNLENANGALTKAGHEGTKMTAESDTQLGELEKDSELADLELSVSKKFRFNDDLVFSRNEIIESRIDGELAQTRKDHAGKVGGIRQDLRASDSEIVGISQRLAEQRIAEAKAGLSALEVRAPHAGLLTWGRDWTGEPIKVGAEVWQGFTLGSLPSLEKMKALVYVLEVDAGGIEAGQSAVLTVDSRPDVAVKATVSTIDAVSGPRFRGSPVRYFGVTLLPESSDPSFMKPGQRVSALIYVENRAQALVLPRQAIHREQGETFVFKRGGSGFERTKVEVGPQSIALSVIESGLSVGDEVALEDPLTEGSDDQSSDATVTAARSTSDAQFPSLTSGAGRIVGDG